MMAPRDPSGRETSGSPSTGEPEYLLVGILKRPYGLHGGLVMEITTDFPERLKPNTRVFLGEAHEPMVIRRIRAHNQGLIIMFIGLETPEAARGFQNRSVYVSATDRPPLAHGMYYHHELVGFQIVDDHDQPIGTLTEIMQTGANDVYVVTGDDGRETLLPVIPEVVLGIEESHRMIRVRPLPGLIQR